MGEETAHLNALPPLLPIPQLDRHVIRSREDQTLGRMHGKATNVIGMGLQRRDLLARIVVEDAQVEIV